MACLDMYNSDHKNHHHRAPASPRISFSSDFVDIQQALKQDRTAMREPPPGSSDFEFSVSNYSMMSADELFFEGRLLPFKDTHTHQLQRTTLRDELLVEEDEEQQDDDEQEDASSSSSSSSHRPSKARWKGFLGLKKSHNATKKAYRNDGSSGGGGDTVADGKRPFSWTAERAHGTTKPSQLQNEGGSSCKDVEFDF